MNKIGPRGWSPSTIEKRFVSSRPSSYDADQRTVDAVISMGSPVKRFYGTEILRISPEAVVLDRLRGSGIPVLDSHQQIGISSAIGRLQRTWFEPGKLVGRISFHDTPEGRKAEGMVARGEITGISAGYRVDQWVVQDSDGNIIDTDKDRIRWDDDLKFTATRWELLEASLVSVPADNSASVRSLGSTNSYIAAVRSSMAARQRMADLMSEPSNLRDVRARMAARHRMMNRMIRIE
jgi:phage head maturation protease